jgi:hypothetical protein
MKCGKGGGTVCQEMYFGHIKVSIGGESGRMPLVKYFHITIY